MKRKLAWLLVLMLAVTSMMPMALADDAQKIVMAIQNDPDILDPGITNNSFASPMFANTVESLVRYDATGMIVPGAAESWTISDDGLVYTFTLREGLKWSDGEELTAEDYIYSWTRVLTPETGARYGHMIYDYVKGAKEFFDGEAEADVLGFKALDERTIEITLENAAPYFLQVMNIWVWAPVRRDVIEANPDGWASAMEGYPSNGPFYLTKIALGDAYVMTKNPNYWNAENVQIEEVTYRVIPDPSTALLAAEKGDVDGTRSVPQSEIPRLLAESDAFFVLPTFAHTYYQFNVTAAPFDDVRVRKAFALAVDRQELIQNVVQSPAVPATGLIPEGYMTTEGDFRQTGPTYDLTPSANIEEAQKLLAEAGYPNGEGFPEVELQYYTDPSVKKVAEALQQMWKANLGVELSIGTSEWKVYYEGVQRLEYSICAMGAGGDYLHPMTFFSAYVSDSADNSVGWKNEEYDALYNTAKGEVDEAAALAQMRELENMISSDMAIIPLYYRSSTIMVAPHVKGWRLDALNNLSFADAYVEK